jgi:hypothetical protein
MSSNNYFNLRRIFLLVKADLTLYRNAIFIGFASLAALIVLGNLISPRNMFSVDQNPSLFLLLLGVGYWVSSMSFRGIHKKPDGLFLLTLPASSLEKLLAKWLITSIGYIVLALMSYTVIYWILAAVAFIFGRASHFTNLPLSIYIWRIIFDYVMLQSIFLMGSIYFKKYAFIKTIFGVICVSILMTVLAGVVDKLFWPDFVIDLHFVSGGVSISSFIIKFVVAVVFWSVAYLRLRESEI